MAVGHKLTHRGPLLHSGSVELYRVIVHIFSICHGFPRPPPTSDVQGLLDKIAVTHRSPLLPQGDNVMVWYPVWFG